MCFYCFIYSQYEAGKARLGDPEQLPRGGGSKAPSAQINYKKILPATIFLYGYMRRDEAAICVCSGRDCFRCEDSYFLPSKYDLIFVCINDWVNADMYSVSTYNAT